jgi:hypothetical protein
MMSSDDDDDDDDKNDEDDEDDEQPQDDSDQNELEDGSGYGLAGPIPVKGMKGNSVLQRHILKQHTDFPFEHKCPDHTCYYSTKGFTISSKSCKPTSISITAGQGCVGSLPHSHTTPRNRTQPPLPFEYINAPSCPVRFMKPAFAQHGTFVTTFGRFIQMKCSRWSRTGYGNES